MLESDHSHDKYIPSFPLIDKNNSCSKYRWIDSFIAINFADNSTNYFLPGPPLSNCWLNLNKKQSVIKVQLCYWQSMATNWALGIFKSKLMYLLTALFSCLIRTKSQRFKDFEVNRELINWFLTHTLWVRTLRHSPLRRLHLIIHTSQPKETKRPLHRTILTSSHIYLVVNVGWYKLIDTKLPSYLTPFSFPFLPENNPSRSVFSRSPRGPGSSSCPPPQWCSACWRSSASACPRRSENPRQGWSNFLAFQVFDFSSQEHFWSRSCQMMSFRQSCWSLMCRIPLK